MSDFRPKVSEKNVLKELTKKTTQNYQLFHYSIVAHGFQDLVGVHPRSLQRKFEANPCSSLREVKYVILHSDI